MYFHLINQKRCRVVFSQTRSLHICRGEEGEDLGSGANILLNSTGGIFFYALWSARSISVQQQQLSAASEVEILYSAGSRLLAELLL